MPIPEGGQQTGPAVLQEQRTEPADREARDADAEDRPTAEELLRALQRARPINDVIPPYGAADGGAQSAQAALLPEGFAVVDRVGRLARDGQWWTLLEDSADHEPPIKLLPDAGLEVMVRTTRGSSAPVRYVVSGEVTVFRGENYLLARVVRRSTETADAPHAHRDEPGEATSSTLTKRSSEPKPTIEEQTSDESPATDVPVEDVLSALRRQQPTARTMPVVSSQDEPPADRGGAFSRTLLSDGSPVVHRPGRIIRDGNWWTFVFESDHPEYPEPPMKLLPNQSVELMLRASARGGGGLVFVVSGEVTLFEGENYLLPRVAMRRIDTGNTRK